MASAKMTQAKWPADRRCRGFARQPRPDVPELSRCAPAISGSTTQDPGIFHLTTANSAVDLASNIYRYRHAEISFASFAAIAAVVPSALDRKGIGPSQGKNQLAGPGRIKMPFSGPADVTIPKPKKPRPALTKINNQSQDKVENLFVNHLLLSPEVWQ